MDFVNDHQLARLPAQERVRVIQTTPVNRPLQILVKRAVLAFGRDPPCQGCFANLARTKEDHAGHLAEPIFNNRVQPAGEDGMNTGESTSGV